MDAAGKELPPIQHHRLEELKKEKGWLPSPRFRTVAESVALQQRFPTFIWHNSGPYSIRFFSGSEHSLESFIAIGVLFWGISRSSRNLCAETSPPVTQTGPVRQTFLGYRPSARHGARQSAFKSCSLECSLLRVVPNHVEQMTVHLAREAGSPH